jgi:hypothetical protein
MGRKLLLLAQMRATRVWELRAKCASFRTIRASSTQKWYKSAHKSAGNSQKGLRFEARFEKMVCSWACFYYRLAQITRSTPATYMGPDLPARARFFCPAKQEIADTAKKRIKKRSIKLRFAMSTHTHVPKGNAQLTLLFLGGGSPTSLGQTYLS